MKKIDFVIRLRFAWFLFGMMFFYGIEQLFLNTYIHDPSARAYVTITYIALLVVFDVPAGMVADKFSRKLCLLLGGLTQIVALLVLGSSNTVLAYLLGSAIFGLHTCLINGAAQALLYDKLSEESLTASYAEAQGANYAAFLLGAAIANISSGFIANIFSLRGAYFISIVPSIVAVVVISGLKEPIFVRKQAQIWYKHLGEVLKELTKHHKIIIFSIQFVVSALALYTIGEFGQIYMLSFGISAVTLGILWAIDAVFAAGGRALAYKFQRRPRILVIIFCFVILAFSVVHHSIGIAIFWVFYGLNEALSNVTETEIQNEASPYLRATTLSVISFAANVVAIPVIIMYNHLYLRHGIFLANQKIAWTIAIILFVTLLVRPPKKNKATETTEPILSTI